MVKLSKLKRGCMIEVQCGCYAVTKDRTYLTKRGYQFILCKACHCMVGLALKKNEQLDTDNLSGTGPNIREIMEDLK